MNVLVVDVFKFEVDVLNIKCGLSFCIVKIVKKKCLNGIREKEIRVSVF